jgi:hypothetical protein
MLKFLIAVNDLPVGDTKRRLTLISSIAGAATLAATAMAASPWARHPEVVRAHAHFGRKKDRAAGGIAPPARTENRRYFAAFTNSVV